MGEKLGKLLEKAATVAVDSASHAFLYEPEVPAQLLHQDCKTEENKLDEE
mgnify:CR=1 FL=1